MDARGRVLGRADGLGHGRRAARGARCQFAARRLDNRDLEPGPRATSGHEWKREPARRGSAAGCSVPARRDQRRCGRRRWRCDAQRAGALRPAAAQAGPPSPSSRPGAHIVAAWAGCLCQRLRHRVVHGRARRDRRRGSGGLPALAHVRSAWAAGDRDGSRDGRLVRHHRAATVAHGASALPATRTAPPMRLSWPRSRSTSRFVSGACGRPSTPAS